MPRSKTTSTATRESAAEMSATEREQRALATLSQTRTRLQDLAARHAAINAELASLDAEERGAEERAAAAQAHAAGQPELVAGARARLLVMAASVAEGSAAAAVEHAAAALLVAAEAAQSAATEADAVHAAAVVTRERLDSERVAIEGEQQELQGLLAHLAHEVEEARVARGEEIVSAALEKARLLEKIVSAREGLAAQAREALQMHCAAAREALQTYPAALASTAGSLLAASRDVTPGERIVEHYVHFLETLERERRHPELGVEAPGPVAPWQLFETPAPQVLAGVLAGVNVVFVPGRLAMARAWLDSVRASQQNA